MLLRLAPLFPALMWLVQRLVAPGRMRPGAWLGGAAGAVALGVGTSLGALAAQVTEREDTKITADLLYAAIKAAGWNLGTGFAVATAVVLLEVLLRGRPVGARSTPAAWTIGLLSVATAGWATWHAWALIVKVGEIALVLEQRNAGLPGRAVDLRTLATTLFTTGAGAGVALVFALLALGVSMAPTKGPNRT